LVFGLAPALEGARTDLVSGLKSGPGGKVGRFNLRRLLVIGQVAGSLVFLLGASLGLRSIKAAADIEIGFDVDSGAVMSRMLRPSRFSEEAMLAHLESEKTRLLERPEITEVHWASTAELTFLADIDPVGVESGDGTRVEVARNAVTPGYLETRGIELRQGREFRASDTAGAPPVAVVNAAFVERFWPGENPLGKTFRVLARDPQGEDPAGRVLEVVGVASDGLYVDHSSREIPFLWVPFEQFLDWRMMLHVDGPVPAEELAAILQREVELFPDEVSLVAPSTYRQMVDVRLQSPRMAAQVLAGSGFFGAVLATLGIYGLLSFIAVLRQKEMAIRQAIGAGRAQVFGELLGEGLRLAAWGIGLGLAGGVSLAHLARGVLYGVSPLDPVAVGASTLILLLAAVLAGLLPARRLADDSPVERLRAN
ncbi:MAG: ABC transporter permease, partial [Holophagales bacterium]|nr:ABC transporter permease [Holophagales bacterium]